MTTPEQELATRLTEAARAATEAFSPDEANAIRRYQALDRTYELVAAVLRDPSSADELSVEDADLVGTIVRVLTEVTRRWRVPEPVRVYRGQRSVDRVSEPRRE